MKTRNVQISPSIYFLIKQDKVTIHILFCIYTTFFQMTYFTVKHSSCLYLFLYSLSPVTPVRSLICDFKRWFEWPSSQRQKDSLDYNPSDRVIPAKVLSVSLPRVFVSFFHLLLAASMSSYVLFLWLQFLLGVVAGSIQTPARLVELPPTRESSRLRGYGIPVTCIILNMTSNDAKMMSLLANSIICFAWLQLPIL